MPNEALARSGLRQKCSATGHIIRTGPHAPRGVNDLDVGPLLAHLTGKLKSRWSGRHLGVCEQHADIWASLPNPQRFGGVLGLDDLEASVLLQEI